MTDEKATEIARLYGGGRELPIVHVPDYSITGKEIITIEFFSDGRTIVTRKQWKEIRDDGN